MGTKTYVSSSMSNLNGSGMEYRWERLSILEGAMANWQHIMQGMHLQKSQLGGQGTGFRNWIYWARNYKFSNYHDPELPEDTTYNEYFKFFEPQISATPELTEEQINAFVENNFNFKFEPEEITTSLKVIGKNPKGELKEITLYSIYRKTKKYKLLGSYQGSYSQEKLGEAYIWYKYDQYLKDNEWIQRYIASDASQQAYLIVPGDGLADSDDDGNESTIEGNADDVYLQLGYSFVEPHIDEDTGDNINIDIFNAEENILIPLKTEIDRIISSSSNTVYYAIWGYFYDSYEIDQNQYSVINGILELDSNNKPVKKEIEDTEELEPNWANIKFYYECSYEDYEKTVQEQWASEADLDSISGFAYIDSVTNVANDPNLSNTVDKDLKPVDAMLCPIVCFRHDKRWINREKGKAFYDWYLKFRKCCEKLQNGDDTYYDTLYDELKEQITQGDVAWVYLIYGLPTNYVQTHYGCHYAFQFFKQLSIPNWQNYVPGDTAIVKGKDFVYTYGYYSFNCRFAFVGKGITYQCGIGICPYGAGSNKRSGEMGVADGNTLYHQWTENAWEIIKVSDYHTNFMYIKNGQSSTIGYAEFTLPIWEIIDVKRKYSKCIIPLMWEIGKNIPYTDWTNLMQFSANIGATAYKVVKTKWYQTGLFKIILTIVIIVVSIVISITSGGLTTGPAAEIGASLAASIGGSTAFWTAVSAVAISVAVAVAVNIIITPILTEMFGPIVGSILGSIVSTMLASYATTGVFTSSSIIGEFLDPMTWVNMANAAINGMAVLIQEKINALQQDMATYAQKAEEAFNEVYVATAENLGTQNEFRIAQVQYGATNGNALDNCFVPETGEQFCNRCIDSCINAISNAIYTLENYPELCINSAIESNIGISTNSSNSSLSQTI